MKRIIGYAEYRSYERTKKEIIWQLWKNGSPMSLIARTVEKPPATVFSYLRYHGGIQPRQRSRHPSSLSLEERGEISRGLAMNRSIRSISFSLDRSPSTVSREINRNGGASRYLSTVIENSPFSIINIPPLVSFDLIVY